MGLDWLKKSPNNWACRRARGISRIHHGSAQRARAMPVAERERQRLLLPRLPREPGEPEADAADR